MIAVLTLIRVGIVPIEQGIRLIDNRRRLNQAIRNTKRQAITFSNPSHVPVHSEHKPGLQGSSATRSVPILSFLNRSPVTRGATRTPALLEMPSGQLAVSFSAAALPAASLPADAKTFCVIKGPANQQFHTAPCSAGI
jgi:hypothetical protein